MKLNRPFTKVFTKPRSPLAEKPFLRFFSELEEVLTAVESVVVQDVRYALTGDATPARDGIAQTPEASRVILAPIQYAR